MRSFVLSVCLLATFTLISSITAAAVHTIAKRVTSLEELVEGAANGATRSQSCRQSGEEENDTDNEYLNCATDFALATNAQVSKVVGGVTQQLLTPPEPEA
ncbi:hypothetical protein G6F70_002555 [Rhizopus microsporus]|uniref:Uncharacterized protein n=2 Tax=Rhizopus TaxID=4842 RepID=A0A367K3R8_RHIAZ|nr:hypothetical protein G6F71_006376 [Rhizopus microsporus]RCH96786.1 hypothetical protein CU097_013929 [Rhizopus azygosporus]KAG1202110.1 hypothetical protein G6F70_002555 [Rhizopus microsporus]KAG1208843.1 hypothetical protein G6F69_006866 [Rhizopus microsporus]KAG1230167.1 hypothetical protein G6F67_006644 [Rhizopus microsporus]